MAEDLTKLSADEIKTLHRSATRLAALIDNGVRIGATTPGMLRTQILVRDRLKRLEDEYCRRFPAEAGNRAAQYLTVCDQVITGHNLAACAASAPQIDGCQVFVVFDVPTRGSKTVTWTAVNEDGSDYIHDEVFAMEGNDYLVAALEMALEEWARTLPDAPDKKEK